MEGETPRTLIRGILQTSHGTRSSRREYLRQTPSTSTRRRESPRLSRSASQSSRQPVSSGMVSSSTSVKRPAQRSLTSEPKRHRGMAGTPSEAITPRTNIRAYLAAAHTKTPPEPSKKRASNERLSRSAISNRQVQKLIASETQSRRTSPRKSLSKSFPTPRENITPREAMKLYLNAADTVPQAQWSSRKRSNMRNVETNLDESSEEKVNDSESAAADDERSQDEETKSESGAESGKNRHENVQSGHENLAEYGDERTEYGDERVESGGEHVDDELGKSRNEHGEFGDQHVESGDEHAEIGDEKAQEHSQNGRKGKYETSQASTDTSSQDELVVHESPTEEKELGEMSSEDVSKDNNATNQSGVQISLQADQRSYESATVRINKSGHGKNAVKWSKLRTPVLPDMTADKATPVVLGKPPLPRQQKKPRNSRKAPSKTTQARNATRSASPVTRLPSGLVSGIFRHFSALRVSKDALDAVQVGSEAFFERVAADLTSYCKHTGRKTIEESDVELLMRRQGLVKSRESFHALIEKYLPMEYKQVIIPTAKSGNVVVPKEKT